jgi:hypothetical protein
VAPSTFDHRLPGRCQGDTVLPAGGRGRLGTQPTPVSCDGDVAADGRLGEPEVIRDGLLRPAAGVSQHLQDQEHRPAHPDPLAQLLVGDPAAEQVGPVQVVQDAPVRARPIC